MKCIIQSHIKESFHICEEVSTEDNNTNKKYKDSVFTDLFYEDKYAKENELALYNALFNTSYTLDQVKIEKIRIDDVVYMKLKNDISFNINNRIIVFCEHQSTINGNMPLRDLLYIARTYEKMVPLRGRYATGTVKIPRPEFLVFYNGESKTETEYIQKLSDAYIDKMDESNVSLELTVRVININTYAGSKLLEKCRVLNEYSQFVETVRAYRKEGDADYMKKAIQHCINNHILEEYLSRKGSEVMNFLCAEYDYEMDMQVKREEAYEDGLNAGFEMLIEDNFLDNRSEDEIVKKLVNRFSLSEDEAKEKIKEYLDKK